MTCLVASEAHSVIISGSLDQTCILWDLEDLSYITQLPEHSSAVSALAINDLTVSTLQQKHTRSEVSLHFSAPKSLSIHLTPAHLIWLGPFGSCCVWMTHLYRLICTGRVVSATPFMQMCEGRVGTSFPSDLL